jgi:hypothetical protein
MHFNEEFHPFDTLTSAMGGRRFWSLLWGLWLFLGICVHYAQMFPRENVVSPRAITAVAVGILGCLTYIWLLIRGLSSKDRRQELFVKRDETPRVRLVFRILVWLVPVLAFVAALAPALIR